MKILAIVDRIENGKDGVGDFTQQMIDFYEEKIQWIVVTKKNENNAGITIPTRNERDCFWVDNWGLNSYSTLKKIIREKKPDWLFIQYVPFSFNKKGIPFFWIGILLLLRIKKVKTSIFFHEVAVDPYQQSFKLFLLGISQRWIGKLMALLANCNFTSNRIYKQLLLPASSTVIPIPSNFEKVYRSLSQMPIEQVVSDEKINIVSFTNRCSIALLDAFYYLYSIGFTSLQLHLVGKADKYHKEVLQKHIAQKSLTDKVTILPDTDAAILLAEMSRATIYIQIENVNTKGQGGASSKSGIMATALMLGLPIITTKGNLTDETYFKNKETVFFAEQHSDSIASAIIEVLNDKMLRENMSANSRNTYNSFFSWSILTEKINSTFLV